MIGRLRARLAALRPVLAPDGQGGGARTFAPAGAVWAEIGAAEAGPDPAADAAGEARRLRIVLHARADIAVGWRLSGAGRTFLVLACAPAPPPSRRIDLVCEEVVR